MAAYRWVYDSRHLQADCQEPVSAPEPYTRQFLHYTALPLQLPLPYTLISTFPLIVWCHLWTTPNAGTGMVICIILHMCCLCDCLLIMLTDSAGIRVLICIHISIGLNGAGFRHRTWPRAHIFRSPVLSRVLKSTFVYYREIIVPKPDG